MVAFCSIANARVANCLSILFCFSFRNLLSCSIKSFNIRSLENKIRQIRLYPMPSMYPLISLKILLSWTLLLVVVTVLQLYFAEGVFVTASETLFLNTAGVWHVVMFPFSSSSLGISTERP